MALPVPATMAEITPAWLTAAFRESGVLGEGRVAAAAWETVGTGLGVLGELARFRLTYEGPAGGAPATLIAKLPTADAGGRALAHGLGFYAKEARFYAEVAGRFPAPRGYYAAGEPEAVRFVVLMEDLGGLALGDQLAGCDLQQAERIIATIARQHAEWWDGPELAALDWIPDTNAASLAHAQAACMASVEPFLARFGESLTERQHALVRAIAPRIDALREAFARPPLTLCHGDLRLDNVFFAGDSVRLVDWQIAIKARGPFDLAYLLSQSMDSPLRKANEERLLRDYHAQLVAAGVRGYSWEQCWGDYRAAALFCVAYPTTAGGQIGDLGNERGVELIRTMAVRSLATVADLDGEDLLERFEARG